MTRRSTAAALAVLGAAGCGLVAGCGGSHGSSASSTAAASPAQVCARAGQAAAAQLRERVHTRVADATPTNIECVTRGRRLSADLIAQATSLAWTEYDTATVHLTQAYGSGAVHVPAELPHPVPGLAGNVAWVPGQRQLIATNGTPSRGGSYVTVTITGGPVAARLPLASAVARATLAIAPRGSNPAPPS
ncbi:MAG: hypothetical protein JOZ07_16360 [Solirubrobacterales bacterium]|nr:hypothetical protein [Solirubrobacterales bacterium]